MTETSRTTVTLNNSYMKLIEELVDVFGATRAQVISNIVEYFFNDSHNDDILEKLRMRKRKENPPEKAEIDKKISSYLKVADKIPFDAFINHLNLDTDFVISKLEDWGKRFNFALTDNKITKIKD
ncbi:MAG: hypothetical protein ACFFE4_07175 [Candidatus Thorarchaeota archaeon]